MHNFFLPKDSAIDRFVVRAGRNDPALTILKAAVNSRPPRKRRKISGTAWSTLSQHEKVQIVECYKNHGISGYWCSIIVCFSSGYRAAQLQFGEKCPPSSTVRGWAAVVVAGGSLAGIGRPACLTIAEETSVLAEMKELKSEGTCLDRR